MIAAYLLQAWRLPGRFVGSATIHTPYNVAMKVAVAHSDDVDSADAITEILQQCEEQLGGTSPDAGLIYIALDHDYQVILDQTMSRYPDLHLIGCSTDGELSSAHGFAEDSVVLILFQSDRIEFGSGIGEGVTSETDRAGRDAVAMAKSGITQELKLCIAHPEGLGVDSLVLLDSLVEELETDIPICGGLAGDQARFQGTFQFYKNRVYEKSVPVLLMAGPLKVVTGVDSGWMPLGPYHRVTKVAGSTVYTIDDRPANEMWEEYFGSVDHISRHHGFAVYPDPETVDTTVPYQDLPVNDDSCYDQLDYYMSMPAVFQQDGSMIVLNPISEGAYLRFGDCTRDQLVNGATRSINSVADGPVDNPDALLVYSCAGRRIVLGTRVEEEARILEMKLGDTPTAGFYTYGEFCPLPGSLTPRAHGGTFVSVLLKEV